MLKNKMLGIICVLSIVMSMFSFLNMTVYAEGTASWKASEGFSNEQGKNQWYYQELIWKNGNYADLTWDGEKWTGSNPNPCKVTQTTQYPGSVADSVRVWGSPINGTVTISGTVQKIRNSGDGLVVRIKKNDQELDLWSKAIGASDLEVYTHNEVVQVAENDRIYFIVNNGGTAHKYHYDEVNWDPVITLTDVPSDPNTKPVLEPIGDKSVNAGSTLEFTVAATDSDGDELTYSAKDLPAGSVFNAQTRTFRWTPQTGQEGTYAVTFAVTDGVNSPVEMTVGITVNTVQAEGITITVPDEIATENNFTATIGFNLNKTILTAGLTITYNPDLVTYKGYEQIEGGLLVVGTKHDVNTGKIKVLLSGTDAPINSGTPLVTLKFRLKQAKGSCEITVTEAELIDVPGNSIYPELASKAILVDYVIPGDANDDGVINLRDLHFVSTHFWKDTNSTDWNIAKTADFIKDGRIDVEDLVYVAGRILKQ